MVKTVTDSGKKRIAVREGLANYRFLLFSVTFCSFLSHLPLLCAYTSLGALRLGDELRGASARSLALGGTALANSKDSAAIFTNPAALSQLPSGNEISVSPGFSNVFYRREHSDKSFSSDSITYYNLQSASVSGRYSKFPLLTAALGWNAVSNFDYGFEEKSSRDRQDQENSGVAPGIDAIKISGNLTQWSAGLSVKPTPWLSVGGAYFRPAGRAKSETIFLTTKSGKSPLLQRLEWSNEFSGNAFQFGITAKLSPTITLGVIAQPQFDLKISSFSSFVQGNLLRNQSKSEMTFSYPDRYGIGILYGINRSTKTQLAADLIYTRWAQSRLTVTSENSVPAQIHSNPFYRNILEFHLGLEHWLNEKWPLRLGFYYLPDLPAAPSSATPFFTFGTGFEWNKWFVDLAGEFGRKSSSQNRFFFSDQRDNVIDTRFRFLITLTYKWR